MSISFKKLCNLVGLVVVFLLHVHFAAFKELLVKQIKVQYLGNRDEHISAFIADFAFNIAFFPPSKNVAKNRLNTVVFNESFESLG